VEAKPGPWRRAGPASRCGSRRRRPRLRSQAPQRNHEGSTARGDPFFCLGPQTRLAVRRVVLRSARPVGKVSGGSGPRPRGVVEVEPAPFLWRLQNLKRSLLSSLQNHIAEGGWLAGRPRFSRPGGDGGREPSGDSPLARAQQRPGLAAQVAAPLLGALASEVLGPARRTYGKTKCRAGWALAGQRPQPQAALARVWRGRQGLARKEGGKHQRLGAIQASDRGLICHVGHGLTAHLVEGRNLRLNA